ncbi:hypothetical protein ACM66B_000065 [Microbotryomycetes sp. NB124-2]
MSLGASSSSTPSKASGGIKPLSLKSSKLAIGGTKKAATAFGDDDDDDDDNGMPTKSSTSKGKQSAPRATPVVASKGDKLTKREKQLQQQQMALDETVYEYDEVYDSMKQGERLAQEQRKQEASERKPKYIAGLIETAELRKRDRLRAEDKMVQREREREGDEFADKDQFVTPAYLAQQEELRRIEEEEKKKEELEAKNAKGLSAFFKTYLDANDKVHEQAVAAASAAKDQKTKPIFTVEPPPLQKSEAEIATDFERKTGRHVEVNDDGEIVDKRQLMSGGLNIVAKKQDSSKSASSGAGGGFSQRISDRAPGSSDGTSESLLPPGMSKAERARQARERHSREIERQMVALEEKRKREAEEQLQNKVEKFVKRNDETKVERLKREAEERRKKREQEANASA